MKRLFISFFMVWTINSTAQNKLQFDLNIGLLKSVGKNISAMHHSGIYPVGYHYNSREQFQHPYVNLLGHVNYRLSSRMNVGVQSGFYFHYYEQYFSAVERTTLALPIMTTLNYRLFNLKSNSGGIEIAIGKIFFHIIEPKVEVHNGNLYNVAAFYKIKNRSIFKLGVEKQVDHVTLTGFEDEYPGEIFKYKLNRMALAISYGYRFGK